MGVVVALAGAVSYGLSDFVGGLTSRRTPAWAVAFTATLIGAPLMAIAALVMGGSPTSGALAWGALAGVGNGVGTAFLYRGLASGRMGVVAPLSGVGAALVPVTAAVVGGERPALLVWAGIVAAMPGIWLVSSEPPPAAEAQPPVGLAEGVIDGVLAGLGFGVVFAALGQVPASAGLAPLAVNTGVGALVVALLATAMGGDWVPREPRAWLGGIAGVLGVSATAAFMWAAQQGSLAVSGVLISLYPAFTIMLAVGLLRERIHGLQALGLGFCATAVVLIVVG